MSYQSIFQVFSIVSHIVNTDSKVEEGTYALCQSLKADGVVYAEIRTGLKDLGNGVESYLQSVLRDMKRAQTDQFKSTLLLSLQRSSSLLFTKQTIDLALQYQDKGIVGIDISGDSTLGNIETSLPEILRAKEAGLSLTVHMGESPLEKDQKHILEILHPHREISSIIVLLMPKRAHLLLHDDARQILLEF
jgi:adenosine deaminase